jgi:hypothetical protein
MFARSEHRCAPVSCRSVRRKTLTTDRWSSYFDKVCATSVSSKIETSHGSVTRPKFRVR